MASDDLLSSLEHIAERLDFGEYEAKAYLTILEHGELTAAEIAEYTDIPQPRVYDTVRSLSDSGLVELRESRPMKVLAIDPEEAFADYRDSLSSLVEGLNERYTKPAREAEGVSLVKSRPTMLRYLEDVIQSAEYELMVSLTPDLLERYHETLASVQSGGVAVEILLSPAAAVPSPEEFDYVDVATTVRTRRGVTTPIVAVADGEYAMYATREGIEGAEDRYGVIFNRSELGFLLSGFLNTVLWTTAETVVEEPVADRFPRRYGTIRRCVADLSRLDGTYYASIDGRDVETGEHTLVEGKIVNVSSRSNWIAASIVVDTGDREIEVGGQVAALEDIEAHEIVVGRDGPPGV
ncbi:HTH-type sugar sensing transcriptional regulator TrmB [Halapricum hydrolyticum]|uniref:TrmB family transcriptional regulator n=1 Tax=Halapricum hydrolyticum TaxID=2979991 RepID=A0AAE3I892_9EURY|nr:TrmB family transcriptional regulator [Halapricum hydrolyticum]MCU4716922.1 TrmB family transcriptional regulator [Halapricum hydrolyticum]MCU4725473.1 TrmB family transcriptional regulator [Halapricum hydrolyticum]